MNSKNYSVFFLVTFIVTTIRLSAQETKLTAFDGEFADIFGYSVAIDGDYAIVGAPLQGGFGTRNAGAAYVFQRSGTDWNYMKKLTPPWGGEFGDHFGYSVDISGNYAIVGAIKTDHSEKTEAGVAYVFVTSGGQWYLQATLKASDADNQDHFGRSVGINDSGMAVVGTPEDDDEGTSTGAIYIFKPHYGNWIQAAKLKASDAHAGAAFGSDVAIDGTTVVVGSPSNKGVPYKQSGAVYVFEPDHYHYWSQTARLTNSDADFFDHFGQSVDIEGDYLIAGAPFSNDKTGNAYIFYRSGLTWTQQAKLSPSDGAPHDKFGSSVGITSGFAAVGSFLDDDLGSESGSLYIYEQSGVNWSELMKHTASDGMAGDHFGRQVDIDGTYAIAGSPYNNAVAHHSGAAYIYGPTLSADQPCQNSLVLAGTIEHGLYYANDYIEAQGIVLSQSTVILTGTNYVTLMPELEIMQGASMEIRLDGCP